MRWTMSNLGWLPNLQRLLLSSAVGAAAAGVEFSAAPGPGRRLQDTVTCPAGTTAAYADEALGFRFRSENITGSPGDNSLRWEAAVPSGLGLAFTMVRPPDPMVDQGLYSGNFSAPSRAVPADVPPGVNFESGPDAPENQIMYSNLKIAIGAENTFFVVVTPSAESVTLFSPLLGFRSGGGPGCFSWLMANYLCPNSAPGEVNENATGCVFADDWAPSGFYGPPYYGGRTYIVVYRTRKRHNSLGVVAPVTEMAIVDTASGSTGLSWTSSLFGEGLGRYNRESVPAEDFDIDLRDADVDAGKILAGGYMQLGRWTLQLSITQFHGVFHALELHDTALSDRHVQDVIANLRTWLDPNVPAILACEECLEGTFDKDGDSASECELCDAGRFSDVTGATTCAGTCETGSTILETGANSSGACTPCEVGSYGRALSTADNPTMICSKCEPGRYSALVGAGSIESCQSCPTGKFSGHGWQRCERSGCMDKWAGNYAPDATVDDGSCVYECSQLWNKTSGGTSPGGCLIFQNGEWQRLAPNGTVLGTGVFVDFPEGHWVVQGRALAGGTAESPQYERYDTGSAKIAASTTTTEVHWRCISITVEGSISGNVIDLEPTERVTMENVVLTDTGDFDGVVFMMCPKAPNGNEISYLTCENNRAGHNGGCLSLFVGTVGVSHSNFLDNHNEEYGGAIGLRCDDVANPTNLTVEHSTFIRNQARAGGAIYLSENTIASVHGCTFEGNVAATRGGAIAVLLGTTTIILTDFISNQAESLGAALHIDQPLSVKILDTDFEPFVDGALVVFIGGRLGGCEEHPCDLGHSCSYAQYSLRCTPCEAMQYSDDGLLCHNCEAGKGPMQNQSGCVECSGNTYSELGVCNACPGRANPSHTACFPCPQNMVADPPKDGCRCESGFYDASTFGPLLCYDRVTPLDSLYTPATESDADAWARDHPEAAAEDGFCQECPADCVDCLYPGYAGRPLLRPGYSANVTSGWFELGIRSVFECPVYKEACRGEKVSQVVSDDTLVPCESGYEGILCAICNNEYSMKGSQCVECGEYTTVAVVLAMTVLVTIVLAIVGISRWHKTKLAEGTQEQPSGVRTLIEMAPDFVDDIKVFIGVYQVLCSLGFTLEITYPPIVERAFDAIRSIANFDAFALPGVSCVLGSSVISKFWMSTLLPVGIGLVFGTSFFLQVRRSRTENQLDDENWDDKLWQSVQSKLNDKTGEDGASVEDSADQTEAAMMKHAVEVAQARQSCIGWAFLLIFVVYPSICTNVFAIYHCFTVGTDVNGDDIAYIIADFRYQCTGGMQYAPGDNLYRTHFWLGMLVVGLYPVGIPVFCGIMIWRKREDIQNGNGPSAIKRLYQAYKPDHCL
eukprot:SAG22_NODE_695_length_7843_cov_2.924587_3_plen_1363_part_00